MKTILSLIFLSSFLLANGQTINSAPSANKVKVMIDVSQSHQTIDNFGASDSWAGQFVGLWPDQKRNAIADLLFSTQTDPKGQPKGIGLSFWRFNLGAGSSEQGIDSKIKDEWRRGESFLEASGKYNWEKQQGQQWFLKAAKQRGVTDFLAFFNSPPVQFSKNGLAFSSDGESNISPEKYPAFIDYMTESIKGIQQNTGVQINYISPVNEPQWDWKDGNQEGSPYTNKQIHDLVTQMNSTFEKKNISTKIILAEAGKLNYLVEKADKPTRGEQIQYFFSDPSTSLKNLSRVEKVIAGHSYFGTSPYSSAVILRERLKDKVASVPGLRFWMTEYCILGNNDGEIKGNGKDLGMTSALYVAKVIHNDLVNANASAWQWWTAISRYNYKDGLVYIDNNKVDGHFTGSKILWALGNYSRFIRPGSVRVQADYTSAFADSLLISAYKNSLKNELICVVVNSSDKEIALDIQLKKGKIKNQIQYLTSEDSDLSPSKVKKLKVLPKSISTFVGSLE